MEGCSEIYFKPVSGRLQKKRMFASFSTGGASFRPLMTSKLTSIRSSDEDEDIVETYFPAGSGVPSLYSQCLELLSCCTHLFESLIGFPQGIAQEILVRAEDKLLTDCHETLQTIELYQEAYPDEFLPNVSLVNSLSLINNYEACLPGLLRNVVRLEMSESDIDDDHDILDVILDISSLKELSLSGNLLTDRGMKRLVLPALSRQNTKMANLSLLDVSFNRLDHKAISRTKLLPRIVSIIVGETDFQYPETLFQPSFVKRGCLRFSSISTSGFGSSLLGKWSEEIEKMFKKKTSKSSSNFYTRKNVLSVPSLDPVNFREKSKNKIMFMKVKLNCSEPSKRKIENENICDQKDKRTKRYVADGNHDVELLKLYS